MSDPHHESTKKLLDPILNVFGGADGGVGFVNLRVFISQMQEKSLNVDDPDLLRVLDLLKCVKQFSRLCATMEGKSSHDYR